MLSVINLKYQLVISMVVEGGKYSIRICEYVTWDR